MQKVVFVILFFFAGFSGKSQEIQVSVTNEKGEGIDNINVQLLRNEKIVDFKKTNVQGNVSFQVMEKGISHLKFTSVYYKTKILEIDTKKENIFKVILESQITEIEMIEIKSRPKVAFIRKDTISFNVKAVSDGTERTTEDLIKKIPGLDINESGKVTYKGNTVGQILVEGNDFFGKNHKLSTQNISADMIEGIDFFKNFTTMGGSTSTALNLKLKDEYKNRITGNVEGNYGTGNSYLFHTNLFKFSKTGNLAFVGDANSIAKNPVNDVDFYEMNSQDDPSNSTNIEVPTFLNNDGLVKTKSNQFGALQYSKANKNFSITAFSVFNNSELDKFSTTKRTAFSGQSVGFNFFEEKEEFNNGFLGTAQIKMKKNFSDKSFLFFNSGYSPTEDNFYQNIERNSSDSQSFNITNAIKNSRFDSNLTWDKPIKNFNMVLALKSVNEKYREYLNINSDKNLFLSNYNSLSQFNKINSNLYAFDFHLKNKNRWVNFNFNSGISYKKDYSELSEFLSNMNENRYLRIYHYINDLNLYRKLWKFDLSASVSSHVLNINECKKRYFEKNFRIKFLPESKFNTEFEFEYRSKYQTPDFKLLYYNPFFTKSLTFIQNASITPNILSKTDSYKLMWSKFNINKGNITFIILTYDRTKPNFTTDAINYGAFSRVENKLGDYYDRWFLFLSNNHKLSRDFMLKSRFSTTVNKIDNFIDNNPNVSTISTIEWSQKVSSSFKNKPFQFDLGYTLTKNFFQQSLYRTKTNQENIKLSLGLRTNIKKEWIGNLLGEYLIQKTENNNLNNFLLGGQLSYRKEKSNFEYNVLFNNLLHLNSFNYINSFASQYGTEEYSITALQGYILGGFKMYF